MNLFKIKLRKENKKYEKQRYYDGSIWPYAQMAKYAREMHGPENFTKALYEGGQASMVLPMIGLSVGTAIIGAGAALLIKTLLQKKENPHSKEKKSAVSAKSQSKRLI